jgi:hypothetical protein
MLYIVQKMDNIHPRIYSLQPRLGPDEVQFGLAANTTSQHHIVSSAVIVGTLLSIWPIMGGYGGIYN